MTMFNDSFTLFLATRIVLVGPPGSQHKRVALGLQTYFID